MSAKGRYMTQDNTTKANDSPKQGGFISKLKAYAEAHPWKLVSGSAKQISSKDLDRVKRIEVKYSKKYEHLYATVFLDNGYASWRLDDKCECKEDDMIDPKTFIIYQLTNGAATITRCNGKVISNLQKRINDFRKRSVGILVSEPALYTYGMYLLPIIDNGKIGFINHEAEVVIKPVYDDFKGVFVDEYDYVCIKQKGKWGIVNSQGYLSCDIEYDNIIPGIVNYRQNWLYRDHLFTVNKNYQWAVITGHDDKFVGFGTFDWIDGYDHGLARVKKGNKWGIIAPSGEIVLPVEYDNIYNFYDKDNRESTRVEKGSESFEIKFSDLYKEIYYDENEYDPCDGYYDRNGQLTVSDDPLFDSGNNDDIMDAFEDDPDAMWNID